MTVSAVQKHSAAVPAKPRSRLDGIAKIGGSVYRHILSFCDINTPITATCKATRITLKDKAKQYEEHLASKGSITLLEIEEWERLKGRKLYSFRPDDPQVAFVKKITRFGDNVVMPSFGITLYLGMFPNLTSIELAGMTITPLLVRFINTNFPHLEKLAFLGCRKNDPLVRAGEVVGNLRQLKSFSWSSYRISEEDVGKIIYNCPGLTHLSLRDCGLTDIGIGMLSRLKDTLSDLDISYNPITQNGVALALANLVNLKKVKFKGLENVDYEALVKQSFCYELDEFSFEGIPDDDEIRTIADHFPKLKKFYVDGETSETALFYLLDHCDELQTLGLNFFRFSEKGLLRFLEYVETRPSLVAHLKPCNLPLELTDKSLRALSRYRPSIQDLSLSTSAITDTGVHTLQSFPTLTSLRLTDVSVTDRGLEAISHLPLTKMKLEHCPFIHKNGIQRFIHNCTTLQEVQFIKMNIGNDVLRSLSNLPSLIQLVIDGDRTITYEGICHLFRRFPNLHLHLYDVSISSDEYMSLRRLFPGMLIDLQNGPNFRYHEIGDLAEVFPLPTPLAAQVAEGQIIDLDPPSRCARIARIIPWIGNFILHRLISLRG